MKVPIALTVLIGLIGHAESANIELECIEVEAETCQFANLQIDPLITYALGAEQLTPVRIIEFKKSQMDRFGWNLCDTFPKLVHLYIKTSRIESFASNALSKCGKLTFLFVYNVTLKSLDDKLLAGCKDLDSVVFEKGQLEYIHPKAFRNNHNLKDITLHNNRLKMFSVSVMLPNVQTLDLAGNDLIYLDVTKLLNKMPSLAVLNITSNQFECTELKIMIHKLSDKDIEQGIDNQKRSRKTTPSKVDGIDCFMKKEYNSISRNMVNNLIEQVATARHKKYEMKKQLLIVEAKLQEVISV